MFTEAIVLAGGKGTRLQSVVSDVPKPMAIVNNKPFLDYILLDLIKQGVETVILSVGYKKEVVEDRYSNNWNGLQIKYAIEEVPLGTGGGISLALEQCKSDNVLVLNGDTSFKIDFNDLYNSHVELNALTTIALKRMFDFDRYGTVEIENSTIKKFTEKSYRKEGLINGGIYAIDRKNFSTIQFDEKYSFEEDYFNKYVSEGKLRGVEFNSYFIDIGIPEDFEKAQHDFKEMGY